MIVTGTMEAAASTRRASGETGTSFRSTYLGPNYTALTKEQQPALKSFGPIAFLIEQAPHSITRSHFHVVDQFQVVVAGQAKLGHHDVSGVAIHFTGPYSPYGPIDAGGEGIHYFTMRNGFDNGANYLPAQREKLRSERTLPHREVVVDPDPAWSAERLAGLRTAEVASVIPMEADGLAAWRYRLPPGAALAGPDPRAAGFGQSWLVLTGTLARGEDVLPGFSCLFVHPDDDVLRGVAGPDGLEILCLQYPRH